MDETQKKWYVIRTVTAKETKVKNLIEKEPYLKGKTGQVVIPTSTSVMQVNKKKISKEKEEVYRPDYVMKVKTHYPGYIMLELMINLDAEIIYAIRSIPGVIGFIGGEKNGPPTPLRKDEVERLLNNNNDLNQESIHIPFVVGENVKITNKGAFDTFCGAIVDIDKETGKLKLEVMIFGRPTPLELNFSEVEKI